MTNTDTHTALDTTHLELSAMLVHLSVSRWTARKTDHTASDTLTDTAEAKHGVARVTKDLLPRTFIRAINARYDATMQTLQDMSLPWSDDGRRLMPTANLMKFQERMAAHERSFWAAVADLQLAYSEEIEKARVELGALFNESDYPGVSTIPSKFAFSWDVEPVPTSADVRVQMPDSLRESIAHQMDTRMQERLEEATRSTFKRVYTQLERIHRVLSAETPRIYDSLMGGVAELIDVLPDLNLTNDPDLDALAHKLREAFSGMTTDSLRADPEVRDDAKEKSSAMLVEIGGML